MGCHGRNCDDGREQPGLHRGRHSGCGHPDHGRLQRGRNGGKAERVLERRCTAHVLPRRAATGRAINDYGVQSHGNALGHTAAGALEIRLSGPTTAIRLAFGNDDPAFSDTSDMARLSLFRGTTQVGLVDANFNANDIMDQTIGTSSGPLFNRVTLQYVDAAGVAISLTEIVDDVTINPPCTIVGTPGNNHLKATSGNDVVCGDSGKDVINGRGGDDLVYGGTGKDTLSGGTGKDHCDGGKGHDSGKSCEIGSNIQ
jgi:Ca2+-binding RTX toxin-like protein